MPRFPQLLSGATAQLPLSVRLLQRTVVNETEDGRQVKGADAAAGRITWELPFAALTDEELDALESLHGDCEGQLRPLTFADPFDNLLVHSETYTDAAWVKSPGVSVTAGVNDPWNTQRASTVTNGSALAAGLAQTLPLPGRVVTCLSAWVRAGVNTTVTLRSEAGGSVRQQSFAVTNTWQRVPMFTSAHDNDAEETTVALLLPAGASLELAGVQLEAQPAASAYKRTAGASGLYLNARFADDAFLVTTTDVNQHSITVRITAPWER